MPCSQWQEAAERGGRDQILVQDTCLGVAISGEGFHVIHSQSLGSGPLDTVNGMRGCRSPILCTLGGMGQTEAVQEYKGTQVGPFSLAKETG